MYNIQIYSSSELVAQFNWKKITGMLKTLIDSVSQQIILAEKVLIIRQVNYVINYNPLDMYKPFFLKSTINVKSLKKNLQRYCFD